MNAVVRMLTVAVIMMLKAAVIIVTKLSGRRLAFCAAFPLNGLCFAAREHATRTACCDFLADGSRVASHFPPTVHVLGG